MSTNCEHFVSKIVNLYVAKTNLSELVDRAARGEEIVIAKAGVPMARLVPLAAKERLRQPGGWENRVWMSPDFDAPLPADMLRAFTEGHPEP